MKRPLALVVDDEPDIRELLGLTLKQMDIEPRVAADLTEAKRALANHRFDLCLTDLRLPDGDGTELVRHIQACCPHTPVAVITAYGDMETAVEALKNGAFDFVSKPVDLKVLRDLVQTALRQARGKSDHDRRSRHSLLGDSPPMQAVRGMIAKVARSQAPVHISGESGTGKELVAQLVHAKSARGNGPFVPVNCGAIPAELVESELFGHKKGSFTGATADKPGLFQAARGGTLFLDEVADLPLPMQVKLLRAIQEKAVRPVGQSHEVPVDVRLLSATHKDLARLVEQGQFRQDLYYRINVIELHVPPLRQHPEDIDLLAEHLLTRLAEHSGAPRARLSEDASRALRVYEFPGNVRELENILERAMTLCENEIIMAEDLGLTRSGPSIATPTGKGGALDPYLNDMEKQAIINALEHTHGNKTAAAKLLGITFRAMRYRLKKLGLE
jgi:two-component system response regulator PilR (NtrC family)